MKFKNLFWAAAVAVVSLSLGACSQRAEQNQAEETESATNAVDPAEIGEAVHVLKAGEEIYPVEGKLVVIDFNATWCGPCKSFAPVFDAVAEANQGKALFYSVDVDEHPDLAANYGVESIPMVVYLKSDGQYTSTVGYMDQETFAATVAELLP